MAREYIFWYTFNMAKFKGTTSHARPLKYRDNVFVCNQPMHIFCVKLPNSILCDIQLRYNRRGGAGILQKRGRNPAEEGQESRRRGIGIPQRRDRNLAEEGQESRRGGTGIPQRRTGIPQKGDKNPTEEGQESHRRGTGIPQRRGRNPTEEG